MRIAMLLAFALSATAYAGSRYNGIQINGAQYNHIEPNGARSNGISINGPRSGGTAMKAKNATARKGKLYVR